MSQANQCANCNRDIDVPNQKFCPTCGQPTPTHRIDWHFIGHEMEHSLLHMDRGIFYSLKSLMIKPGVFIRDYIEGRRARHVKPLMLVMIMTTIMLFLAKYFTKGDLMSAGLSDSQQMAIGAKASGHIYLDSLLNNLAVVKDWMNRHYAATTVILLPWEAISFKLAFRRIGNLNYPEWLVITTYLTAQSFVIMAFALPIGYWLPSTRSWLTVIASAYGIFTLMQFFKTSPRWETALRGLVALGFFTLTSGVLTFALAVVLFVLAGRH
ncbi:MAG: DUF3667 domain-containing protein [Firmicutes bacterium]|nr:DUF3667 domain-containing protein [Bacillota bacterium]